MASVRYCLVKVLRIGDRSLCETSRGSRSKFLKNVAHFYQCPLAAADMLVERPLEMSHVVVRKL